MLRQTVGGSITAALLLTVAAAAVSAEPACVPVKDPSHDASIAKELIDTTTGTVYIAGGANAISDADWVHYQPPVSLRKNSTRHLLFERSCYLRSFSAPEDCSGQSCLVSREIDGATWIELARSSRQRCLPDPQGCTPAHGTPGNLRATALVKCQTLEFAGRIHDLSDGTGNRFVMHATGDGTPSHDVALPPGWTLTERTLEAPLIVRPASLAGCEYVLLRDARDQSYHQYDFSGTPLF
jgi:hypothetical protein